MLPVVLVHKVHCSKLSNYYRDHCTASYLPFLNCIPILFVNIILPTHKLSIFLSAFCNQISNGWLCCFSSILNNVNVCFYHVVHCGKLSTFVTGLLYCILFSHFEMYPHFVCKVSYCKYTKFQGFVVNMFKTNY